MASEIADLGVVAFGVAAVMLLLLVGSEEGASDAGDVPTLRVVAPLTAVVVNTINATKAIRQVCG